MAAEHLRLLERLVSIALLPWMPAMRLRSVADREENSCLLNLAATQLTVFTFHK
jgi:hypothetical protein